MRRARAAVRVGRGRLPDTPARPGSTAIGAARRASRTEGQGRRYLTALDRVAADYDRLLDYMLRMDSIQVRSERDTTALLGRVRSVRRPARLAPLLERSAMRQASIQTKLADLRAPSGFASEHALATSLLGSEVSGLTKLAAGVQSRNRALISEAGQGRGVEVAWARRKDPDRVYRLMRRSRVQRGFKHLRRLRSRLERSLGQLSPDPPAAQRHSPAA